MDEIKVHNREKTAPAATPPAKKNKSRKNIKYVLIGLVVVVIALGGTAAFFYSKYQKVKNNPDIVAKEETDFLVSKVGKLMTLPTDETPNVATIIDKEKLKDQPFFNNAQNGDKILIFSKAQQAIIFRPSDNKIINVGPISLDQSAQVPVSLMNAGGNSGEAEKKLNAKFATGIILSKGDAKNKNAIQKTLVVDVSGKNAQAAQEIAAELGGTVGAMPAGEIAPQGAAVVVFVK